MAGSGRVEGLDLDLPPPLFFFKKKLYPIPPLGTEEIFFILSFIW